MPKKVGRDFAEGWSQFNSKLFFDKKTMSVLRLSIISHNIPRQMGVASCHRNGDVQILSTAVFATFVL